MTEPTTEDQKHVEILNSYILQLVELIDDGDVGTADEGVAWDDQTDGTFHAWVDGWKAFYANWKSGKWPTDPGVSLQFWRNSANAWWDLGRRSGQIVRSKDVAVDITPPPKDEPPPKKKPIKDGFVNPKKKGAIDALADGLHDGFSDPARKKRDGDKVIPPAKKDAQETRKTPWVALLLVAGPLLFLWARRRSHGS